MAWVLVLVGALLGLAWFQHAGYRVQRAQWEMERRAAERVADSIRAEQRRYEAERRRWQQEMRRRDQKIAALNARKQPVRFMTGGATQADSITVGVITHPVIDTCRPVVTALVEQVALRDSIVELKDSSLAAWDRAHAHVSQQYIAAREQWAKWEHLAKTKPGRSPLIPKLGVGGAVGVDTRGLPNAVLGLTLSWTF